MRSVLRFFGMPEQWREATDLVDGQAEAAATRVEVSGADAQKISESETLANVCSQAARGCDGNVRSC